MAHARTRDDWADRPSRRPPSPPHLRSVPQGERRRQHRSRLPKHARSVAAMAGVLGAAGIGAACVPLLPVWLCLVIFVLGAAALVGWFR